MAYALDHTVRVILTTVPVVITAWCVARLMVTDPDGPKRLTLGLLIALTVVCVSGALLGFLGALSFRGYLLTLWPGAAVAFAIWRKRRRSAPDAPPSSSRPSWPILFTAAIGVVVTMSACATKLSSGIPEYDELTYHLFLPSQWLADQRITQIDTPFGDGAPGYAPANGELWYAWLMAPMAGPVPGEPTVDALLHRGVGLIAIVGQLPFLILLGGALTMLSRRLGASQTMQYLPAALLPFIPSILRQASSASVDLMMGSLLVAALAFLFEYQARANRLDAIVAGVALGLACGIKFVALVSAPLVAVAALFLFWQKRDQRAAAAFLIATLLCGAPWYLRNVLLTGNPLFPAHVSLFGLSIFPGAYTRQSMTASEFHRSDLSGMMRVVVDAVGPWFAIVCAIGLVLALLATVRSREWRVIAWIAPVAIALHFLAVPYNTQERFLIWAFALTLLPFSLWADTLGGRLSLAGLVMLLVAASLAGSVRIGQSLNGIAASDLQLNGYQRVLEARPRIVAYAGRNIPYFLAGHEGRTLVRYINVDGRADRRLFDYVNEARASGALDLTMEKPDWVRQHPDYEAWRRALIHQKVEYFFVEPLVGAEARYLTHDGQWFPIERGWARAHPDAFELVAAERRWELFKVRQP